MVIIDEHFFRGDRYRIAFRNIGHTGCRGIKAMKVDGKPVDGNVIIPAGDGRTHEVEVIM